MIHPGKGTNTVCAAFIVEADGNEQLFSFGSKGDGNELSFMWVENDPTNSMKSPMSQK